MWTAASLSFLLVVAVSLAAEEDWVGKGDLKMDVVSETFVQGTFSTASGSGIHFSCGEDTLLVTTLDGHPLIVGETSVGEFRVLTVDGNDFILKGGAQYAVPKSLPSVRGSTDENKLASLVRKLEDIPGQVNDERFQASVGGMITRSETALLKATAFALGEGKRVTGLDYPVMMPFYRIALIVENIFQNQTAAGTAGNTRQKRANYNCDTFSTCPPCTTDNCIGMCGRMCDCWPFVCGDCCFVQYCFTHDLCCRDNGFYSYQCFAVIGSGGVDLSDRTCRSNYGCPSPPWWWG